MDKVYLIAPDGGLRQIPSYLADDLVKQGWKVVINPKRNYYPEYDVNHPGYDAKQDIPNEVEILEVEIV